VLVLLLAVLEPVQVRAPHQALDDNTALGSCAEEFGDARSAIAHPLVRIAAPVGEEQVITRAQRLDFRR
jgi:hypothetical protein